MFRRSLVAAALVCALASLPLPVSAGDPHDPGDDCPPEQTCTSSSTTPPFVIVLINGVPTVIWL